MALNDFVRTPRYVTEALLENESFDGTILEPCCGDGAISKVLQASGYQVTSSDKFDYGFGSQKDLFYIQEHCENAITNPPFTHQQKVKRHLLSITNKKLALLWYVKNLGNEMETKSSRNLKAVYIFDKRIEWVEAKLGWLFAWYVWEKGYEGDVTIRRIKRGLTKHAADSWDSSRPQAFFSPEVLSAQVVEQTPAQLPLM